MNANQNGKYSNCYILAPVSAQAQIKRNSSEQPLRSADTPRIICDLNLDEVPLSLIDVSTKKHYSYFSHSIAGFHKGDVLKTLSEPRQRQGCTNRMA